MGIAQHDIVLLCCNDVISALEVGTPDIKADEAAVLRDEVPKVPLKVPSIQRSTSKRAIAEQMTSNTIL